MLRIRAPASKRWPRPNEQLEQLKSERHRRLHEVRLSDEDLVLPVAQRASHVADHRYAIRCAVG